LVVFVRHALPGELVRAVVTQATARFARADAVEVLAASPDRVPPPCPYAGPVRCGGCDWQHASLPAQRALKAAVVSQQLSRIAGIERDVVVEALDGDQEGLDWRTVVSFATDDRGAAGLRKHRSHEVVEVDRCAIAHPLVMQVGVTGQRWPAGCSVEVCVSPSSGERGVLVAGPGRPGRGSLTPKDLPDLAADSLLVAGRAGRGGRPGGSGGAAPVRGRGDLIQHAAGRDWRVTVGGFWQVHPGAADALAGDVLAALEPRAGETALDLYCGAGLFAGVLARAVGPNGGVVAIEQDQAAVRDARHNLREWPWARVHRGDVGSVLDRIGLGSASIVVLDPPRTGVARPVIEMLDTAGSRDADGLRRLAYVSCDPATLARDLRLLTEGAWELTGVRGYDAFPMTHHVECLATLIRR
jgi:tRNA/tmRNA/rRNA uracil-C5-methylase (TrmA/RlmC/RlmD family)